MAALEMFIKTYTEELRTLIGQIPKEHWIIFPDFFYLPYIIRARKCPNGVAILFKRPANRESIAEEVQRKEQRQFSYRICLPLPILRFLLGQTQQGYGT